MNHSSCITSVTVIHLSDEEGVCVRVCVCVCEIKGFFLIQLMWLNEIVKLREMNVLFCERLAFTVGS